MTRLLEQLDIHLCHLGTSGYRDILLSSPDSLSRAEDGENKYSVTVTVYSVFLSLHALLGLHVLVQLLLISFVLNVLVHKVPDVGTGFFSVRPFNTFAIFSVCHNVCGNAVANELHRVFYIRTLFIVVSVTWGGKRWSNSLPSLIAPLSVRYHTPLPFFIISSPLCGSFQSRLPTKNDIVCFRVG